MQIGRSLKWLLLVALVIVLAAQFVGPARTNPPIDPAKTIEALVPIPSETDAILKRACADCHSYNSVWPWYSHVAPTSWFVIGHVDDGRRILNLSDWTQLSRRAAKNPDSRFDDICRVVKNGDMPLSSYLLMHPGAKLTDADRQAVCDWATAPRGK